MRTYKGISLNHLDPTDPGFVDALRSALNELNLFCTAVQRELSPTQMGSTTASGAANTEPYVVATSTSGLSAERVLTGSSNIGVSDGGANSAITLSVVGQIPVANGGTGSATAAAARAALGADAVSVNGSSVVDADFDDATPAAPAGGFNVAWQADASSPANISANVPVVTPAFTFGTTSNAGSAANTVRSDAQISLFSASTPSDVIPDTSATVGTSGKAARADHKHGIATGTPSITLSNTFAEGSATQVMRTDGIIKAKSDDYFVCSTAQKGLVSKDTQGTARYWAMYVKEGATTPASGDVTINISSVGVVTATRAGGAAGDVTIVLKDLGTSSPF